MAELPVSVVVRLVNRVTEPLRRMTSDFKAFRAAQEVAGKRFELAGNIRQAAEGVATFARGAGALIDKPLNVAQDFQRQLSTVSAVGQRTAADMEQLRATALRLGADTAFSSSQAAQGMFFLTQQGFSTTQVLAAMRPVLDLAAASGVELGEAADITANILAGFKLPAEQAARMADVLAQTTASSSTDIRQLYETMSFAAPIASDLGISLEETAAMAGLLGNAGIKGSRAGTALNAMIAGLVAARGRGSSALKALQIDVADSSGKLLNLTEILESFSKATATMGNAQRARVVAQIFGREAAPAVTELLGRAGTGDIRAFSSAIADASGAAGRMATTMLDNAAGASEQLSGSIEALQIQIGSEMLPVTTSFRLGLTSLINRITGAAQRSPLLTRALIGLAMVVRVLAVGLAGLLFTIATLVSSAGIWSLFTGTRITALQIMRGFIPAVIRLGAALLGLLANPVVLAIVALTALGVAIYQVGKHWQRIRAYFMGVWERFTKASTAAKVVIVSIGLAVTAALGPIGLVIAAGALIVRNWEPIRDFFVSLWEGIKSGIEALTQSKAWQIFVSAPLAALSALTGITGEGIATAGRSAAGVAGEVVQVFTGPSGQPAETLSSAAARATEAGGSGGAAQRFEGHLKVDIDSRGQARVRELRSEGGIDVAVHTGLVMATP